MKLLSGVSLLIIALAFSSIALGQNRCASADYIEQLKKINPSLSNKLLSTERFIIQQKMNGVQGASLKDDAVKIIHIPVVVHILYNGDFQNISNAIIKSQIDALNRDYRRQNADSTNTPARFRSVSADVQIDFALATSDETGRATTGIVRKHTNKVWWQMDDKVKFAENEGDKAWDSKSYLNIWVCNLQGLLGYSSIPGGPPEVDGVVISFSGFGTLNTAAPYQMGRTAVHEVGHWLGLKHIWGDSYCGDDLVDDTPKQGGFTSGCPGGVFRSSCDNGSLGDMYMNYMDFTDDACMNLFTKGQKERMLSLFNSGGPRASLLASKGLEKPWVFTELPKTTETSRLETSMKVYPNPAAGEVNLVLNDNSYIGQNVNLVNLNGSLVASIKITSATQKINIDQLKSGMYFLEASNGNGKIRQRFIKL